MIAALESAMALPLVTIGLAWWRPFGETTGKHRREERS